jgi:hypothetical protein
MRRTDASGDIPLLLTVTSWERVCQHREILEIAAIV